MNNRREFYVFGTPASYRIRILGLLDKRRAEYLCGMRISSRTRRGGAIVTALTGQLADQAALIGVLSSLYDMGFALLEVKRLSPLEPAEDPSQCRDVGSE